MTIRRLHRSLALLGCLTILLAAQTPDAQAHGVAKRQHALSLVNPPVHDANFTHFGWVNPAAPKGGRMRLRATGSFDTLNAFTIKGSPAAGLLLIYDTLMASSLGEPSTEYGLVAEWVSHPADYSSATFGLRPSARFHDGTPITPDDVVFSLQAVKAASPRYGLYFQDVVKAEKTGASEVTFRFAAKGNRELPHIIGSLPVLPRHFWQARGADGKPRDPAVATMEVPLGSGPYRIADVDPGRSITYARVTDWWAKDLPVSRGQWNFDTLAYVYYRDRTPAFEGFKSGEIDFWPENSAKGWATGYDIEPVQAGHIKRELIASKDIATMQGFVFNLRRRQFADARVREAFNLAFNFEWFNKHMFYDQYARVGSYFENSDMKASGLPKGRERALLESVHGLVPHDLFTQPWHNPVNVDPGDFRKHMRRAAQLLAQADGRCARACSPAGTATSWKRSSFSSSRISSASCSPTRPNSSDWACGSPSARSTARSTAAVSTASSSISSSRAFASRCHRATSSANTGDRRQPTERGPATSWGSRTRQSMH
ncbi:MAG: extracellular solute-binding protein [Hyphomicrobiaceae bacterium]